MGTLALRVTFLRKLSPTTLSYIKSYPNQKDEVLGELVEDATRHAADYVTQWLQEGSPVPTVAVVDDELNNPGCDLDLLREALSDWVSATEGAWREVEYSDEEKKHLQKVWENARQFVRGKEY